MRKLNKVMAVVLAGCMLLPGIGASADNETAKSVVITGIDREVTITAEKNYSAESENAKRINIAVPDYEKGKEPMAMETFTVDKDKTANLKFDMIDGGTAEDTCDLTLYETVDNNGKTIKTAVGTIENLPLKTTVCITGLSSDKKYYFTVQSKTKAGNASFLLWISEMRTLIKYDGASPGEVIFTRGKTDSNKLQQIEAPSDVLVYESPEWNKYLNELTKYGLFEGDANGDFTPYKNITRAEMAKVLCKALRISPDSYNTQMFNTQMFSDVDSSHWAFGYINALAATKIVEGNDDGSFSPDREATYAETVKMLVTAMGYAPRAEGLGGYPYGYIETARELDLIKDIDLALDLYCPRYIVFTLMYNALDVPFLLQTGFGENAAEFAVADGKNGMDYVTFRYKITGKKN